VKKLKNRIKAIQEFLEVGIWQTSLRKEPKPKVVLIKSLRIILIAIKSLGNGRLQSQASALTYYSLLSVVPVFAMFFGIAKGFGMQKHLEQIIIKNFSSQEEVMNRIIEFANSLLQTTKGGIVAGIGLIILLWSIIKVLSNIEKSFNNIWEVHRSRPLLRKLTDYLGLIILAPVFLILASSSTVFITSKIEYLSNNYSLLELLSPAILSMIKLLPYVLIWLILIMLYMIMPNTRVKFTSALIAAIIAGSIYQLTQWAYISFQIGVSRNNAIYGSFAALPLFLIWIHLSWMIVLLGAEISFAHQNSMRYEYKDEENKMSSSYKKRLSLLILHKIFNNFSLAKPALTAEQIAIGLDIPIRLIRVITAELSEAGLLNETLTPEYNENAYQPARDINQLSINKIIDIIDNNGKESLVIEDRAIMEKIENHLKKINESAHNSPSNILLKDL